MIFVGEKSIGAFVGEHSFLWDYQIPVQVDWGFDAGGALIDIQVVIRPVGMRNFIVDIDDLTVPLVKEGEELPDSPLVGTWCQYSVDSLGNYRVSVIFFGDGRGYIWGGVTDPGSVGAMQPSYLDYSLDENQVLTLSYDIGGSDTLHLLEWNNNEVLIEVEGNSEWFVDGILERDD